MSRFKKICSIRVSHRSSLNSIKLYNNQYRYFCSKNDDKIDEKNSDYLEWVNKYKSIRSSNEFSMDFVSLLSYSHQWEYFKLVSIIDPIYKFGMNSWFTGFSDRFLHYEEMIIGVTDAFQFIVECLDNNEYELLRNCFIDKVYNHIKKFKKSLLTDDNNNIYKLDRLNAYVYDLRVDRGNIDFNNMIKLAKENNKNNKIPAGIYNTPVDVYFEIKYYLRLYNEDNNNYKYKIADIMWKAKYQPIYEDTLKYQIKEDWVIQYVTISDVTNIDSESEISE